jgi:hypothetical protein
VKNTVNGPRGVMRCIPLDEPYRKGLAAGIGLLLSGRRLSRAEIFGFNPSFGYSSRSQNRLLRRLVEDGAVNAIGSGTSRRHYETKNRDVLSRFSGLLEEKDPLILKKGHGNRFTMKPELRALLDGLLLGNGHYTKLIPGGLSCALMVAQCEAHASWLEALKGKLAGYGIESDITKRRGEDKILPNGKHLKSQSSYSLRTKCYRTLTAERLRWYPLGKKIVPRDIDLSNPVTLAQWHMGDGCAHIKKKTVQLATCGFTYPDVRLLAERLSGQLGIRAHVQYSGYPFIAMWSRHAERFLELVRPHMVPCFEYKAPVLWEPSKCTRCGNPIKNRIRLAKICDDCCLPRELSKRPQRSAVCGLV